jgi:hypothetical protein
MSQIGLCDDTCRAHSAHRLRWTQTPSHDQHVGLACGGQAPRSAQMHTAPGESLATTTENSVSPDTGWASQVTPVTQSMSARGGISSALGLTSEGEVSDLVRLVVCGDSEMIDVSVAPSPSLSQPHLQAMPSAAAGTEAPGTPVSTSSRTPSASGHADGLDTWNSPGSAMLRPMPAPAHPEDPPVAPVDTSDTRNTPLPGTHAACRCRPCQCAPCATAASLEDVASFAWPPCRVGRYDVGLMAMHCLIAASSCVQQPACCRALDQDLLTAARRSGL